MTYFAAFNVDTPGTEMRTEKMSFVSEVDQTVYISAYTYDPQHIRNGDCGGTSGGSYMYFIDYKTNEWLYPMWGNNHVRPLEMAAGEEISAKLEVYWAPGDLAAHDYSIVVQAEKSPVTIRRAATETPESAHFPVYKLSANVVTWDSNTDGTDEGD